MRTSLSLFLLRSLTLIALCFSPIYASEQPLHVGVVSVDTIIANSSVMKDLQTQMSKWQLRLQNERNSKEEQLKREDQELQKKQEKMEQAAFEKEVQAFTKKIDQTNRDLQERQRSVDAAFQKAMEQMNDTLYKVVEEVAKEKKLDIVLPTVSLLYRVNNLDISKEVETLFSKKLTKITLDIKEK